MNKLIVIFCVVIFGLAGCEEEKLTRVEYSLDEVLFACDKSDKADFVWLDQFVAKAESQPSGYYAVELMKYKSSIYILLQDNLSASPPAIYNCDGDLALADLGLTYNEFMDESIKLKSIYSK
ncbi:hypothetical protein [uncultured Algoriphagus sp.]|uniref:hypothetical protein n=1 Tax=uncultured Algoriphagus sp. TaxID=417365 RepID=UPI0030ECB6EA|tara:strand:- start:3884 stop:4249 length:366 start_codon:yes stop_codon:yes gene_type:complete